MHIKKILLKWLPLASVIIISSGTIYVAVQQNYRMSANDQQIQIAQDAATALGGGLSPDSLIPPTLSVDIDKSLSLNIALYDEQGKPLHTSAKVDGKEVNPPAGVFDKARQTGENRFTWQPKTGVRQAAVLVHYDGKQKGFVLVARSLTEVEKRIDDLGKIIALGTFVALFASLLLTIFTKMLKSKKHEGDEDHNEAAGRIHTANTTHSDSVDRSSAETSSEGQDS